MQGRGRLRHRLVAVLEDFRQPLGVLARLNDVGGDEDEEFAAGFHRLLRAKQKTAFDGGPRRLLAELAEVRCCRLIDVTGQKGRPRVRWQIEEFDQVRRPLVEALHALPALS